MATIIQIQKTVPEEMLLFSTCTSGASLQTSASYLPTLLLVNATIRNTAKRPRVEIQVVRPAFSKCGSFLIQKSTSNSSLYERYEL